MDQTNDVLTLKAEIYDLSKQMQQMQGLLGQIAQIVRAETVDEMMAKITKAFAPPVPADAESKPAKKAKE